MSTPVLPAFDSNNFTPGQVIDNPRLPYKPGTTWVYETVDSTGAVQSYTTVTATNQTRMIDGVQTTVVSDVVRDPNSGAATEVTKDYFAQDKSGNVWYLGEDTQELKNGKVVSTQGTWHAGVNGALPGFVMEANPQVGDFYRQEFSAGVAEDKAQVIGKNGTAHVPYGHFDHLLVTRETTALEPGAKETKSYAAGIGEVYGKDIVTGDMDKLIAVGMANSMASFGESAPPANAALLLSGAIDSQPMLASPHG